MRQNKLFTSIYVAGTGLSIAFTMVLFIIYYVKFAPVYPEYNRDRTLVLKYMKASLKDNEKAYGTSAVSYEVVKMLKGLPHLDKVGAISINEGSWSPTTVTLPENQEQMPVAVGFVDTGFWDVFTFRFLYGKPFTEAEVESNLPVVILTESIAQRIFATTDAVGKYLNCDGNDLKVCGVVADVSNATPATSANIYVPIHFKGENKPNPHAFGLTGGVQIYMTVPTPDDMKALQTEVEDVFNRHNQQDTRFTNHLMGQPDEWWKSTFRTNSTNEPDLKGIIRSILYMLCALLFIPAMNLCGMISSRMDERMSELGVRKAYGANNAGLLTQVLCENLLLTIIGGLAGLAIAYLIALTGGQWVLQLFNEGISIPTLLPTYLTVEMLFNPTLFGIVFALCVLLNLISALVPTLIALRRPIIQSIQTKR